MCRESGFVDTAASKAEPNLGGIGISIDDVQYLGPFVQIIDSDMDDWLETGTLVSWLID